MARPGDRLRELVPGGERTGACVVDMSEEYAYRGGDEYRRNRRGACVATGFPR
ncbi:hypothetical protein [Embleya sp. NPDC059237]|uniref:hypothetical protein n=1 Tax=Embleya sp. NPDC059237 TaxID=3346784 RepID=UPI003677F6DB